MGIVDYSADNIAKRMRALFNATQSSVGYGVGDLNVHVLDAALLHRDKNSVVYKRAQARALHAKSLDPSLDVQQAIKESLSADIDGINFQSRAANQRMMAKIEHEITAEVTNFEASKYDMGLTARREAEKRIATLRDNFARLKTDIAKGKAFNLRAFGDTSIGGLYAKGDFVVISNEKARSLVRRSARLGRKMTDEEIDRLDLIVSENKSRAMGPLAAKDIVMGKGVPGRITIDPVSNVGQVYSDFISIANMGEMYNPVMPNGRTMLENSLADTLAKAKDEILNGNIKSLEGIVKAMDEADVEMFDEPEQYYEFIKNREFIQKIQEFVSTGGNLQSNPAMTREALRIVKEQYFNQRRFGETINFLGDDVTDLRLRIPIPNSVKAHAMTLGTLDENPYAEAHRASKLDDVQLSRSVIANPGESVILPDFSAEKRFIFGAGDISGKYGKYSAAFGGPDFDDLFGANVMYDPEAKRTMALISRSPNALSEYAYLDVDLALSPKYGKHKVVYGGEEMTIAQINMKQKEINMRLEKESKTTKAWNSRKGSDHKRIARLMDERDALNDVLHSYYSSSESGLAQVRLSDIYRMDDATGYRRNVAPAGTRITDQSLSSYVAGSTTRGYATSAGTIEQRFAATQAEFLALHADQVNMPWVHMGNDYNELLFQPDGITPSRIFKDANTQIAELEARRAGYSASLLDRNAAVAEAHGLLGKTVDTSTVIDDFIRASIRDGVLTPEQIEKFTGLVEGAGKITRLDREKLIDFIQKTGDPEYIALFQEIQSGNLTKLGRVLGGMEELGLDPALLAQRLRGENLNQVAQGYGAALGRTVTVEEMINAITLGASDPRSKVGMLYGKVLAMGEGFDADMDDAIISRSQNLIDDIAESGFKASQVEVERSRLFLKDFLDNERAVRGAIKTPEQIENLMQLAMDEAAKGGNVSDLLGEFTGEDVHRRSMRLLNEWGLLDDRSAMNRQLVAIRQMAAERDIISGKLVASRALNQTSLMAPNASLNRLAEEALQVEIYERAARQQAINGLSGIDIQDRLAVKTYVRDSISEMLEESKLSGKSIRRIRVGTLDHIRSMGGDIGGYDVDAFMDSADSYQRSVWDVADTNSNSGAIHHAMRSTSDELAEEVVESIPQNKLRRMNMKEFDRLLASPGFRKGLGAAALFAGIGIVHELRGDRSPAEMEGPLLSPDSNSYTGGPGSSLSMPVGPLSYETPRGMTYSVRANGSFDPYDVSSQMGSLTGASVGGTISSRSALPGMGQPRSSSDVLNSYLGDY